MLAEITSLGITGTLTQQYTKSDIPFVFNGLSFKKPGIAIIQALTSSSVSTQDFSILVLESNVAIWISPIVNFI